MLHYNYIYQILNISNLQFTVGSVLSNLTVTVPGYTWFEGNGTSYYEALNQSMEYNAPGCGPVYPRGNVEPTVHITVEGNSNICIVKILYKL